MTTSTGTQIHLANRPIGVPTPDNFATVRADLPALAEAEVRVQNAFISVDPYMRGRMSAAKDYVAPYSIGEIMSGAAVGHVVETRSHELPEGTVVLHQMGWRILPKAKPRRFVG